MVEFNLITSGEPVSGTTVVVGDTVVVTNQAGTVWTNKVPYERRVPLFPGRSRWTDHMFACLSKLGLLSDTEKQEQIMAQNEHKRLAALIEDFGSLKDILAVMPVAFSGPIKEGVQKRWDELTQQDRTFLADYHLALNDILGVDGSTPEAQ